MNETVELVNKLILIITPIVMTIFISWASWCIISHATAMMSAKTIEAKKKIKETLLFLIYVHWHLGYLLLDILLLILLLQIV